MKALLCPSTSRNSLIYARNSIHLRAFHASHSFRSKPFTQRLREAFNDTKIKWFSIPLGLGFCFISFQHYRHVRDRERRRIAEEEGRGDQVVVARGPWQVKVAAVLPLRNISRLWGDFNSIQIPIFLRPAGFKLYSWIFGCNLEEMKNSDLKSYRNLSEFFTRELKYGARPIEPGLLVSPVDGKVLHFGLIDGRKVEQIKGMTYSLDAFIGSSQNSGDRAASIVASSHSANIVDEEEFANVNGIPYSLDHLATGTLSAGDVKKGNGLFFCVIYLAPGDYHRFHSPTNWVVEKRRHFAGELFSVSPYMVKLLENLFVLNERVVLLGRWRHGSFTMVPVGATNVGSIRIVFDEDLRTNQEDLLPLGTYTEASYKGGKLLRVGDEIGMFCLGSTVVLIFEAPLTLQFQIKPGQKIKVGQTLADFAHEK